jgi:hypothetical protein
MEGFQLPVWDPNQFSNMNFGPNQMAATNNVPSMGLGTGYQPLEFGMNIPTFQLGLQGLGTLGNLWGSLQSNKLARDSFNFQKDFAQQNLANQIKNYNTTLTDRATSRGFVQGDSAEKTQQYIDNNKL